LIQWTANVTMTSVALCYEEKPYNLPLENRK